MNGYKTINMTLTNPKHIKILTPLQFYFNFQQPHLSCDFRGKTNTKTMEGAKPAPGPSCPMYFINVADFLNLGEIMVNMQQTGLSCPHRYRKRKSNRSDHLVQ